MSKVVDVDAAGKALLKRYGSAYESVHRARRNYEDTAKPQARVSAIAKKMREFEQKHNVCLCTATGKVFQLDCE